MATSIVVIKGDIPKGEYQLRGKLGSTEMAMGNIRFSLSKLQSVDKLDERRDVSVGDAIAVGTAGGILLGALGAAAGVVLGGAKKKMTTFSAVFSDGRKFVGIIESSEFVVLSAEAA